MRNYENEKKISKFNAYKHPVQFVYLVYFTDELFGYEIVTPLIQGREFSIKQSYFFEVVFLFEGMASV